MEVQQLVAAAQSGEAPFQERVEQRPVMAWAKVLEGKEHHGPRVRELRQEFLGDRAWVVTPRLLLAVRADRLADFGKEQPQQIGEFRGGSHRRTGRAHRIFLFDGDRGADVDQPIDVRAGDLVEKHPRVGREGFHIAPLPLCKQRVKGQGRLAGPGQACDCCDPVVRNAEGDVLEIVLARPFDDQVVRRSIRWSMVRHSGGSFERKTDHRSKCGRPPQCRHCSGGMVRSARSDSYNGLLTIGGLIMFDRRAYLARIGYEGATNPSIETLRRLHLAHVLTVPFENLDIHVGRSISLEPADIYRKVVENRQGGYCFELNGLFALLLEELGFTVTRLAARVLYGAEGVRPRSHQILLVPVEGNRRLVDVGFGGHGLREPFSLAVGQEQQQGADRFRLVTDGRGDYLLQCERSSPACRWTMSLRTTTTRIRRIRCSSRSAFAPCRRLPEGRPSPMGCSRSAKTGSRMNFMRRMREHTSGCSRSTLD
ncbi:MAG: hypothetical protein CV089_23575 [Nitrospira sp. WS110]|nr:hypothetical protein [Nitrospira sp. WS110]